MAQDIFEGTVTSYDSKTGDYFIRLRSGSLDTERGVPARLLSPIAYQDGGSIKAAPAVPRDSQCLVLKDGNRHYIIGFLQPHGLVVGGDAKPSRPIEEGEMFITHKTKSKIGFSAIGTIVLVAQKWAQAAINPVAQQLTAAFRNVRLNLYSAIVEYFYDMNKKEGTFKIIATKALVDENEAVVDSNGRDRFILKAGVLEDDHIIELKVDQDIMSKKATPKHHSTTKIGKQKDGTYFEHSSKTGETQEQQLWLLAKNDSTMRMNFKKEDKQVDIKMDMAGEEALTLTVNNDKAILHIMHDGNIRIETTDDKNIFLGGKGKEQQLVTKTWLDQIFTQHTHLNGNQGAPTGPPIGPAYMDVGADSSSAHFTTTTKAE